MQELAPAAIAFVISPLYLIPPSAMMGTPALWRTNRFTHRIKLRNTDPRDHSRGANRSRPDSHFHRVSSPLRSKPASLRKSRHFRHDFDPGPKVFFKLRTAIEHAMRMSVRRYRRKKHPLPLQPKSSRAPCSQAQRRAPPRP